MTLSSAPRSTAAPVIQTDQLTKQYPGRSVTPALDSLTLTVLPGQIFGYLGPNGAGKTTTIRILMDIIRPTSGQATVLGLDARQHSVEIHKRVGFMPGELNLWPGQTAENVVRYMARVRGGVNMTYVQQLAKRLEFDLSKRVRDYSTGNKRKLGLILALMHEPELLVLDEPTSGLDPLMQQIFMEMMQEWRNKGRTVFLSSHVLSEVQAICDRVAILREGKLQAVEDVSKLTHTDFKWVTLHFRQPVDARIASSVPGVTEVTTQDNQVRLRLSGDFDPLLRAFSSEYLVDMQVREPTLEEIFLAFYGERSHSNSHTSLNGKTVEAIDTKERA
jgi:ABC-2 type transport system ATP-binding protein